MSAGWSPSSIPMEFLRRYRDEWSLEDFDIIEEIYRGKACLCVPPSTLPSPKSRSSLGGLSSFSLPSLPPYYARLAGSRWCCPSLPRVNLMTKPSPNLLQELHPSSWTTSAITFRIQIILRFTNVFYFEVRGRAYTYYYNSNSYVILHHMMWYYYGQRCWSGSCLGTVGWRPKRIERLAQSSAWTLSRLRKRRRRRRRKTLEGVM